MSLKAFLALTDDEIIKAYDRKEPDITKLRDRLVKRLDKAVEQFRATEPARGRKIFGQKGSNVKITLPIWLGSKNEFGVPAERFEEAIKQLRAATIAGEVDDDLLRYENNYANDPGTTTKAKTSGERKKRAGWSDEERARRAANRAARKAAQA